MKSYTKFLIAGVVAVVCGAGSASAQNVIRNSGNGQFNSVNVQGGFGTNKVIGSGNGTGNTINVQGGGFGSGFGQNKVINSGNGTGNTINVGGAGVPHPPGYGWKGLENGGYGPSPIVGFDRSSWSPYPLQPAPVYPTYPLYPVSPWSWGGKNVIRDSGNGTGNTINVQGGGFGSNTIRNSGNGNFNSINVAGGSGFNRISGSGNGTGNTINVRP